MPFVTALVIISKLIDVLGLFLGQSLLGFLPRFAYVDPLISSSVSSLANFDGVHYLRIAQFGYSSSQYSFFPFYPLLIRILSWLFLNNYFIAALFISFFSFVGFLILLTKYLKNQKIPTETIKWTMILFLLFPTSFFLTAAYTESLFLFLYIGYVYFFSKKKHFMVFLFGLAVGATRFTGFILTISSLLYIFFNRKGALNKRTLISSLSPLLGLIFYCGFLYIKTGDPLSFFHSLSIFGPQRSSNIILLPQVLFRYIKILFTAQHNFQYFVALLELLSFLFCFIVIAVGITRSLKKKGVWNNHVFYFLGMFSFINMIIPTFSGSLSSFPRYFLTEVYVFYVFATISRKPVRFFLVVVFVLLRVVFVAFFSRGYFIS